MDEDVERHLRRALNQHAASAPDGGQMLAAVQRESGRRRVRRRTALGAALTAAVLVAGVLAAPLAARLLGPGRAPAATATLPTTVLFAPGGTMPNAFPYTPHAPLLGQTRPVFTIVGAQPTLSYKSTRDRSGWATVIASAEPWPAMPATGKTRPVEVRGRQGLSAVDDSAPDRPEILLRWSESLWWLEIRAPLATPLHELVAYANGMVNQPLTQPAPFIFDYTPAGFTVDNLSMATVSFCPPGVAPSAEFTKKLTVLLDPPPSSPLGGRLVQVGGRTGWLGASDGITMLRFGDGAGRLLTIQVGVGIRVAERDLLTFAAGIHTTSAARPGNG